MRAHIQLILLCLIALMLPPNSYPQAPFAEESPAKTDLREAVFRYMFDHYNYGPNVKVYCIGAERPLPDNFIQRFSQIKPHVVLGSDCETAGWMSGVRNRRTGELGMLMTIISIQWIGGQEATVHVEAFSDGLAANWNSLRLVFKTNHWKVVKDTLEGMS